MSDTIDMAAKPAYPINMAGMAGVADMMAHDGAEVKRADLDIEKYPLAAKLIAARVKELGWTFVDGRDHGYSGNWTLSFRHPTDPSTVMEVRFDSYADAKRGHHFSVDLSSRIGADSVEKLQEAIAKFANLKI